MDLACTAEQLERALQTENMKRQYTQPPVFSGTDEEECCWWLPRTVSSLVDAPDQGFDCKQ